MSPENLSRRSIMRAAAALPAAAVLPALAAASPVADPDAELVVLGARLEKLVREKFELSFQWAPLLREAHAEVRKRFGDKPYWELSEKEKKASRRLLSQSAKRNGCRELDERMSAIGDAIEPIAEAIMEADATTLGGLRAKALVVLWEVRPGFAYKGELNFPDDGGATASLFHAVAAMTGLAPMVKDYCDRLKADVTERPDSDEAVQS